MRTVLQFVLAAILLLSAAAPANAQTCGNGCDSTRAPFDGLYLYVGPRYMDYEGLDGSLNDLGYSATGNWFFQGGITVEERNGDSDSERPTSQRFSLYAFRLPGDFDIAPGTFGTIGGWGIMTSAVMPFVYNNSTRFAFTLGIGFEWTTLTVRREITFKDFVENATDNTTEADRGSAVLQPGLRFDYRFSLFGDPVIIGLETGYSWDYTLGGTWGDKIVGIGDDSNSGFFAALSFGVPFRY